MLWVEVLLEVLEFVKRRGERGCDLKGGESLEGERKIYLRGNESL